MPILLTRPRSVTDLSGFHLYHFGMSNCSQRVRLMLEEKGLPWTGHVVDLTRDEHATREFLEINPQGLVPVLIHNGRVVTESLDILDYLEEAAPSPTLRPAEEFRPAGEEISRLAGEVQPALKLLSHEYLFKPLRRMGPAQLERFAQSHSDADLVQFMRDFSSSQGFGRSRICRSAKMIDTAFTTLEAQLEATPWLGGDRFSLADIAWMPNLRRMTMMRFPLGPRPKLRRWLQRVSARSSFRRALLAFEPWPLRLGVGAYAMMRAVGSAGLAGCLAQS